MRAALAFFALFFSLVASFTLRAEEWGIAYSGLLLEVVDGVKIPLVYKGATNYAANVYVRIYDESEGAVEEKAEALWGRKISVSVRHGMFSCELKDSAGTKLWARYETLQDAFAHLTGDRVSVGVTPFADTNDEITPRQSFAAVPFAVNAGDALGTVGDVTVSGKLTIGAARVPSAAFEGPVTHDGETTFVASPVLSDLALGDTAPLKAETLVAGDGVAVSAAEAGTLTVGKLSATVKELATASFSNLTVSGTVKADELKAIEKKLTVTGDATATTVKAQSLVLGGTFDFFKWDSDVKELPKEPSAGSQSKTYWHGSAGSGDWTAPAADESDGGDYFVSLSFKVTGKLTVKMDTGDGTATVATLTASGSNFGSDGTWLPFQAFLLRGQKISWSGEASDLKFNYRQFKY